MNAVTLNTVNQVGPAALSPTALSQGATAGGGFIDLVSLLLATVSTDSEPSAATADSSSDTASSNDVAFSNGDVPANLLVTPQLVPYKGVLYKGQFTSATSPSLTKIVSPGVTSATPDQIASALIRFMAKGEGPGAPVGNQPTGAGKKAFSDQRSANTSKTTALTLFPVNLAAIAPVAPQPAVTVDPQVALKTLSIPGAAEFKTGIVSGPVASGPAINEAVANGAAGLASPVLSLPDPSSFDLKLTGPPSAATAPVAFKMQLTPLTSQESPDQQTTSDPHSNTVPQGSSATEITPAAGPAAETLTAAPSTPDPVSNSVFALVSAADSAAGAPTASKGPALNAGKNPDEPGQATGAAAKTSSDVTAPDQTKQGSGQKSNTDAKSDAESSTSQNPSEKNPVAAASSAPEGNQVQAATFPALHTPAPPPAPSHAGNTSTKSIDQPAATQVPDAKDLATPPPSSGQTQQIDVRISQPQTPPVDLQVTQRAGQIQVVVRTPDAGLETALRQDLGTLVHSLERSGFQAETFIPNTSESSHMNSHADTQHHPPDSSGNGSFGQGGGQNQGRNGGRGSGGNSRGNASRDPQFEAWTNPYKQQQEQQP